MSAVSRSAAEELVTSDKSSTPAWLERIKGPDYRRRVGSQDRVFFPRGEPGAALLAGVFTASELRDLAAWIDGQDRG